MTKAEREEHQKPETEEEREARLHKIRVEAGKKAAATRKAHAKEQVSQCLDLFVEKFVLIIVIIPFKSRAQQKKAKVKWKMKMRIREKLDFIR